MARQALTGNQIKNVSLPAFQQELFSPNFGSGKDLKCDKNAVRVNQYSIIINNTINLGISSHLPSPLLTLTWWTWRAARPLRAGRVPSLQPDWASHWEFGGTASCPLSSFYTTRAVLDQAVIAVWNEIFWYFDRLTNIFLRFSNVESLYYPLCLISLTRSNNLPQGFIQKTLEVFLIMRSTTITTSSSSSTQWQWTIGIQTLIWTRWQFIRSLLWSGQAL